MEIIPYGKQYIDEEDIEAVVNTAGVELDIYAKLGDIDGDSAAKTTITGGAGTDTLYLYNIGSGGANAANNTALLGDGNNNNKKRRKGRSQRRRSQRRRSQRQKKNVSWL